MPVCKEKEEAIAISRTEGIDRCIVLRVRVGKHELRFLVADIPLPPLVYLCMSHYAHDVRVLINTVCMCGLWCDGIALVWGRLVGAV